MSDGGAFLGDLSSVRASRQPVRRPNAAQERLELLGDKPAAVFADGSRVPLTLRRAEILALPDSRSQRWSAEDLAYELHGNAGTPRSIRTEMFRVPVDTGRCRRVEPIPACRAGRGVRIRGGYCACCAKGVEALEAYNAPLLSRSGALAVRWIRA
jgi:hypothetical protein